MNGKATQASQVRSKAVARKIVSKLQQPHQSTGAAPERSPQRLPSQKPGPKAGRQRADLAPMALGGSKGVGAYSFRNGSSAPRAAVNQRLAAKPRQKTFLSENGNLEHKIVADVAEGSILKTPLSHQEPQLFMREGKIFVSGTEFLCSAKIPPLGKFPNATVPQGYLLAWSQLNPYYIVLSRMSQFISCFDQYRLSTLAVEYVPSCPTTTSGSVCGFMINTAADNPTVIGDGNALVRYGMEKDGAVYSNVWCGHETHLNQPQQEWFFVANTDDVGLSVPGQYYLVLANDYFDAAAAQDIPIPIGGLLLHYELELRSPSIS